MKALIAVKKKLLYGILFAGSLVNLMWIGIFSLQVLSQLDQDVPEGNSRSFVQTRIGDACIAEQTEQFDLAFDILHSFRVHYDIVIPVI